MTRELNRRVAVQVCKTRHPLEWSSPAPRSDACAECTRMLAIVLDAMQRIVGRNVRIG